jgi:HlyD family secretion protein
LKKSTILELKDMSDSREVLSERPHRFVVLFVYILIILIVAALVWAFMGHIDYYVKAQGEVRPNESISVVRNTVTGRVLEVNLSEGQRVKRGELLFAMDVETQLNTVAILERQLDAVTLEITNMEKYRTSIILGENLFDGTSPDELDYYLRYQKYITDREVSVEQVKNANLDFTRILSEAKVSESNAKNSSKRIEAEIAGLRLLLRSVDEGENLLSEHDAKHYGSFLNYKLDMERYAALIERYQVLTDRAEALYEVGGLSQKQLESARFDLKSSLLEWDKYRNEFRFNINQNIDGLESSLLDLNASIQSANTVFNSYSERGYSEDLTVEKCKLDALAPISDTLFNLRINADGLQKDLSSIRLSISEARVTAIIEGVISLNTEISVGDYLQSGMEIASIIPGTAGDFKVILAVFDSDITDVTEGQIVFVRFNALPYNEYGELEGRITKISTDSRSDSNGQSYYLAEAELSNTVLTGRDGKHESIKVGMAVDVRVITKTVRIIHWVLDKLNFIDG